MQTSSTPKSETPGSQLDLVLSQSVEGGLKAIHAQIDESASLWTKMRVQRQAGAIAGQMAIDLFRVHNEAKERAISAVIVAKHGILQKELLKANLAATAELDAAIAGIFMETRASLTKIMAKDEQELFKWEVSATEEVNAKVANGELSEHRAKSSLERINAMVDAQVADSNGVVNQIVQNLQDRVTQALKPFVTNR
ncbi:hypothetical protein [Marivita sp. XM-24bin2]|uniref:hypothetical protein n=1 Tax=Marivita sp. XM-24bin2 TaxID=2133951 RepID=UPI000D7A3940|nr:hypothetical protein [Marivita sp. XM-24bin2]PWL33561.1 MAG: hypothetical protein DCO97_18875 [Marivita sp. XM-24bin2]